MKKIFIGKDDQLRGGWQIVVCLISFLIATAIFQIIPGLILKVCCGGEAPLAVQQIINAVISIAVAVVLVFVFMKLNHSSIRSIGFDSVKNSWKHFIIGSVTAVVSMAALAVLSYMIGDYHIVNIAFTPMILMYFIKYIGVGINEEVLCRGFMQHAISPRWGTIWSILFPSLLFGSLHLMNDNFSWIAMINTTLVGIAFGIFTYQTGNLAAAIGYHIFWNFFQGNIFGIVVSGYSQEVSLMRVSMDRSTIWTGGDYGLEGGLACTILLIVTIGIQMCVHKNKKK